MSGVINEYSYRIQWSEEDGQYIGTVLEFPSLSWLADTREEARDGIKKTVQDAIRILREEGREVPKPQPRRKAPKRKAALKGEAVRVFNQKTMRIPTSVHRRLAPTVRKSTLRKSTVHKQRGGR